MLCNRAVRCCSRKLFFLLGASRIFFLPTAAHTIHFIKSYAYHVCVCVCACCGAQGWLCLLILDMMSVGRGMRALLLRGRPPSHFFWCSRARKEPPLAGNDHYRSTGPQSSIHHTFISGSMVQIKATFYNIELLDILLVLKQKIKMIGLFNTRN
jgi:hypothetical protein